MSTVVLDLHKLALLVPELGMLFCVILFLTLLWFFSTRSPSLNVLFYRIGIAIDFIMV